MVDLGFVEDSEVIENPRAFDNLGTMVCFPRRYNLGDPHPFSTPEQFLEEITPREAFILPLYLYVHSGMAMSTGPFNDPWDSGQMGWKLRIYSGSFVQKIFVVGNRHDIERAIKDLSDVRKLEKHAT